MAGYKCTLYKLTFPNGMVYIGSTKNITSRWYGDGVHYKNQKVGEAIKECGWDSIGKQLLLCLPQNIENDKVVRKMEKELILAYGSKCYNVKNTIEDNYRISQRHKQSKGA